MIRVTLISHAMTEAVRAGRFPNDEDALNPPLGPAVSVLAGHWLAGPELRARSTAAALAGSRPVVTDLDLRDWNVGRWRGRTLADLSASEPEALAFWMGDPGAAPHGGESLLDLLGRVGRWLRVQEGVEGRLAAIAHPAVLRAAIVRVLDAGPAAFWHIDIAPLSRVRLSRDGRRWVLQELIRPTDAAW